MARRSYRVAMRRKCLSLLKKRSTVAQLVSDSVMGNEGLAVAERRDNRCRSGIGDELAQSVVVVRLVGDDGSGRTTGEESGRGCAVMRLTTRQDEAQRAAEGIDDAPQPDLWPPFSGCRLLVDPDERGVK